MPPQRYAAPQIPQDVPVYRITDEHGFFADATLFPQDTVLIWEEEPNPNMEPLNEKAGVIMKEYLEKLDVFGRIAAEKAGKAYKNLADAYQSTLQESVQDGKRSRVIGAKTEIPLLSGAKAGKAKVSTVEIEQTPEIPTVKGKFSLNKAK